MNLPLEGYNIVDDLIRKEALKSVKRFEGHSPMFYRQTLLEHSLFISHASKEFAKILQRDGFLDSDFDLERAILFAHVHDDAEFVRYFDPNQSFYDIPSYVKASMDEAEKGRLDTLEEIAIETIDSRFPVLVKLPGGNKVFPYKNLLREGIEKSTPESQLVSLVDKLSGKWFEVAHEAYAGNVLFFLEGHDPAQNYREYVWPKIKDKHPLMKDFLDSDHPLNFYHPKYLEEFDLKKVLSTGKPHNLDSLLEPTGCIPYDFFKGVVFKSEDSHLINHIATKKE